MDAAAVQQGTEALDVAFEISQILDTGACAVLTFFEQSVHAVLFARCRE